VLLWVRAESVTNRAARAHRQNPGGQLLGILRSYEQLTDDGLLAFVV
jgi:hypothetical protein